MSDFPIPDFAKFKAGDRVWIWLNKPEQHIKPDWYAGTVTGWQQPHWYRLDVSDAPAFSHWNAKEMHLQAWSERKPEFGGEFYESSEIAPRGGTIDELNHLLRTAAGLCYIELDGKRFHVEGEPPNRRVTRVSGLEQFIVNKGKGDLDSSPGVLLPCPFCGHEAAFNIRSRDAREEHPVRVECTNTSCGVRTPEHYATRETAAAAWNTRQTVDQKGDSYLAGHPQSLATWMPDCVCGMDPQQFRHSAQCPLRYWWGMREIEARSANVEPERVPAAACGRCGGLFHKTEECNAPKSSTEPT